MHSYPLRFIMPEADKMKSPAYGEYHAEQWTCDQPTNCRWLTLWRILRRTVDMRPANQLSMVDTMANITQNSGPVTERTWTYQATSNNETLFISLLDGTTAADESPVEKGL